MGINFRRLKKRKDGKEINGTIDEMWNPVVNRKLRSDPTVAQLVVAHEKTHGDQGVNHWGDLHAESEAHLAATRELQRMGKPKKVRSGFGRDILRELEERKELYLRAGGDPSFDATPDNLVAMTRAGWTKEKENVGGGTKEAK